MRCARLQCTSLNLGKFQSCVSTFKFGPSFASAQLARALRSFLSRLPPVLAGGSTVKSSSPNKSWSRIPVNRGRDPSLADSESLRAVQQRLGQQSVLAAGLHWQGLFHIKFTTNLRFQGLSLAEPTWASGKFKSMSGPVTSWQEPGAQLDPRRTSNTSQQVPCDARVGFSGYIPCINQDNHHGMHAGSVAV